MKDLIERQAAINAICSECQGRCIPCEHYPCGEIKALNNLPSVEPEIIRCKDCKFWREHKYAIETKRYIPFCGFNAIYTKADDFCSRAERRTDEQTD